MIKKIPHKPPRLYQDNGVYFLTFCTFKRLPLLLSPGIAEFIIDELHFYERKLKKLVAYTIMPDHVHLIVKVEQAASLSTFLRDFKSYTSKEILKRLRSRRPPAVTNPDQHSPTGSRLLHVDRLWQPGTMDHCIRFSWTNDDFKKHLEYVFYNSWKHLRIAPRNFPYHNFTSFVDDGIFDNDFCNFDESRFTASAIYE